MAPEYNLRAEIEQQLDEIKLSTTNGERIDQLSCQLLINVCHYCLEQWSILHPRTSFIGLFLLGIELTTVRRLEGMGSIPAGYHKNMEGVK